MKPTQLVLYFIPEFHKEKKVTALCRRLGMMTRKMKPSDAAVSVGSLAGVSGIPARCEKAAVPEDFCMPELLIFCGLSEEQLDRFLAEYKKEGMEPIALKAVLTQYNGTWSLGALVRELQRERAELEKQEGESREQ